MREPHDPAPWVLWGSKLSPFALKVEALLRFTRVPHRWLPADGSSRDALRFGWRREQLIRGRIPLTSPPRDPLDEFPLLPFLLGPGGENLGLVPVMQQNRVAFERQRARGERCGSEAAFDSGRALYDGVLLGRPFRSVAKSFQVRVWRDLLRAWRALAAEEQKRVEALLPSDAQLDDGRAA